MVALDKSKPALRYVTRSVQALNSNISANTISCSVQETFAINTDKQPPFLLVRSLLLLTTVGVKRFYRYRTETIALREIRYFQ
ncbi:unnamed protein product [Angiostrongylus costaricensis]|uniref:Uncharacterized protein n=1 Tax=Angiostrongylus costaricensis TaxID=334426 RepID=A0A158PFL8_ANGCS|nr:unnamed protein product [Angiostrongylus costaricensis]